ncbi:LamG domain-containing protein [Flavobacterium sp.]|uniref:LamG domain-containing protein n=1 Tax=Flavobacterium sp. TaxID=239 RepID=UPI0031D5D62F
MKKILLTLMFVSFLNANSQNPVQEFNFNGNLNSADNTLSFLGAPVYANDRTGAARGALRLTNKAFQVVVGDLPQANKPRTISVWVKFNAINAVNHIVGYGTAANAQYFGLTQQASAGGNSEVNLSGWGPGNDVLASVPLAKEVWYMYSITYDGNVSKIYRNGELLKTVDGIQRATKGYILNIGKLNTVTSINADIDDLKLYTVAMTDEQVMEAYNSSKPAGTSASAPAPGAAKKTTPAAAAGKTAGSPNEPNKVVKNVEVFSQGKKIMGVNATNIGELPEGTYLIKVSN